MRTTKSMRSTADAPVESVGATPSIKSQLDPNAKMRPPVLSCTRKIDPVCPADRLLGLAIVQDDVFASVKAKLFEVAKSSVLVVSLAATEIAEILPLAAETVTSPAELIVMPPAVVAVFSMRLTLTVDISGRLYGPGGGCWIAGVSG